MCQIHRLAMMGVASQRQATALLIRRSSKRDFDRLPHYRGQGRAVRSGLRVNGFCAFVAAREVAAMAKMRAGSSAVKGRSLRVPPTRSYFVAVGPALTRF